MGASRAADGRDASNDIPLFLRDEARHGVGRPAARAEGCIELDAPLTTYLPDIPYRNGATVRQVLSHQAGLPNPMPLSWVHADDDPGFDESAFLDRVLSMHRRCAVPGRRTRYSNVGFLLLGRLVEVVAGRPYAKFVRERIVDTVRCNDSGTGAYLGFDVPKVTPNTIVKAYGELEISGVVHKRRGSGTFVSEGRPQLALRERRRIIVQRIDALLAAAHQLNFTADDILRMVRERKAAMAPGANAEPAELER